MVGFNCHFNQIQSSLRFCLRVVSYNQARTANNLKPNGGNTMAENRTQDYFDDNDDGHVDTREKNFECDNPDKSLGCDMGIDVQG